MMSDNANTFRSASSDIKKIRQDKDIPPVNRLIGSSYRKDTLVGGLLGVAGAEYK